MSVKSIIYICILVVLVFLSAVFSGADMAYSSVNTMRLQKSANAGDKRSARALRQAKNYDKTIATILFGNDFANVLASSLATVVGIEVFTGHFHIAEETASTISAMILVVIILIFGEIMPKAIAMNHSYRLSRLFSGFTNVCEIIFFPFTYPTNALANVISKPVLKKTPKENKLASDEELSAMVDDIEESGIIDEDQSDLIHRSLVFKETSCYEIITPRVKILGYDLKTPFKDFVKKKDWYVHSRIIVYEGDLDHIHGYLQAKTLLRLMVQGKPINIEKLILPIISVPRTMMISQAMEKLKGSKHHICVVRDEWGGTEGILTLEDILEEMVGEMWDEEDKIDDPIVNTDKRNVYIVKGSANITDVFERFDISIDDIGEDYSTLSGFLADKLQRFPKVGDEVEIEKINIVVTKVSNFAVQEAKLTYHPRRRKFVKQ
ncbi:MAG: hemolysin family protein [Bacilli bacterium]|nr:hemolysin family protein [Bacilli bacterium]